MHEKTKIVRETSGSLAKLKSQICDRSTIPTPLCGRWMSLVEEGFLIDFSIFPIRHDIYGIPDGERFPYWQNTPANNRIFEFSPSTIRLLNVTTGVAGGGYLRLFPSAFTQCAIRRINDIERKPVMVYFHPWEIDPRQPRIPFSWKSGFRHYTNQHKMYGKIEKLLRDFRFNTVSRVSKL